MSTVLEFFANLILFTAGMFVLALWILLIFVGCVELWDAIFEDDKSDQPDEEDL